MDNTLGGWWREHRSYLGTLPRSTQRIQRDKWHSLARPPISAAVSPYNQPPEAVTPVGRDLKERGAEAILLDCIGFTERHRDAFAEIGLPVILSNAVAAKAAGELLGG